MTDHEYKALRVKEPTHTKVKIQAVRASMDIADYVQWMADVVSKMGLYPPKEVDRKEVTNV